MDIWKKIKDNINHHIDQDRKIKEIERKSYIEQKEKNAIAIGKERADIEKKQTITKMNRAESSNVLSNLGNNIINNREALIGKKRKFSSSELDRMYWGMK